MSRSMVLFALVLAMCCGWGAAISQFPGHPPQPGLAVRALDR